MEGKRFIQRLALKNLLSYSDVGGSLELLPLNVLIGPNGSGKSNLIEALSLFQAAPTDISTPIREGGGVNEWLWKGAQRSPTAMIEAIVTYPRSDWSLHYHLEFTAEGSRFSLATESIDPWLPDNHPAADRYYYRYQDGVPMLAQRDGTKLPPNQSRSWKPRAINTSDFKPDRSILAQRRDPDLYPELTYLAEQFGRLRFYRDWNLGRNTAIRRPQPADLPNDFLLEDASNLNLVLNSFERRSDTAKQVLTWLRRFYETAEALPVVVFGSTVELLLREAGLQSPVPAARLSDGTLRFLCLLAILLHPDPPPLICLEEPELGLHPDILPTIAELLLDASQRTQLVITTHSDVLVSALSKTPEAVVVCERGRGGTTLRRLEPDRLQAWLERYTLGELWSKGEIGGNRW